MGEDLIIKNCNCIHPMPNRPSPLNLGGGEVGGGEVA